MYVAKNDLMKIYSEKPEVYIKRLADLIFGTEIRAAPASGNMKNVLDNLDASRLKSFLSKAPNQTTKIYFQNSFSNFN